MQNSQENFAGGAAGLDDIGSTLQECIIIRAHASVLALPLACNSDTFTGGPEFICDFQSQEARLNTLIIALAAGDRTSLRALYDMTAPLLSSIARMIVRNAADAEEIVSDVYVRAWRTAASYDASRGSVRAWLIVICRSCAIDRYRKDKCRRRVDSYDRARSATGTGDNSGVDDCLIATQDDNGIQAAIERLPDLRRRILNLAFSDGMTHAQIATATRIRLGTVKSHIRRALITLRVELNEAK